MSGDIGSDPEGTDVLAGAIMEVFTANGYRAVSPPIIQPAEVFLDVIGEAVRGRTYLFTDQEGEELCLRPDLTVPACRYYLEQFPKADTPARYCYNGPAFRFQPQGGDAVGPREFHQVGLESFGDSNREQADADVLAITVKAIEEAGGIDDFRIVTGDLGLMRTLLAAIEMPARWRTQLAHDFWRKDVFHHTLERLSDRDRRAPEHIPRALLDRLDPDDMDATMAAVEAHLDSHNIMMVGERSLAEISEHLLDLAIDTREKSLSKEARELIEAYVSVRAPMRAAGARINDLMTERGINLADGLESYHRRIELLSKAGVPLMRAEFSGEFGRNLGYYSDFVFQIEIPNTGRLGQLAGGGRYDTLLRQVGAPHDVPGVGVAIHTERLLAARQGDLT